MSASCVVDNQGPCYRYWHTDVVLLGEVRDSVRLEEKTVDDFSFGHTYRLRVEVLEGFRGVGPAGSIVLIDTHSGECGFNAEVGERVFFYAQRQKDGALGASLYSQPFEHAGESLDYARSAAAGTAAARVYGDVMHRDDNVLDAGAFTPLPDVTVHVRGAGFEAKTTTDSDGHYSIRLPGTGSYEVTVVPPAGMANRLPYPGTIEIGNPQECMSAEFQLLTNGRIRGVVVDDATGRPIPNLVLRAGNGLQESKSDRSGAFDIGPLSAGVYDVKAMTGGGVTLLPGSVTVRSARPTELRPLVARLSRPLSSVTFDLKGLPGDGWIEIRDVSYGLQVGRDREATFAVERGETLEVHWGYGDDTKWATVKVNEDAVRVRLSQLPWQPTRIAAAVGRLEVLGAKTARGSAAPGARAAGGRALHAGRVSDDR